MQHTLPDRWLGLVVAKLGGAADDVGTAGVEIDLQQGDDLGLVVEFPAQDGSKEDGSADKDSNNALDLKGISSDGLVTLQEDNHQGQSDRDVAAVREQRGDVRQLGEGTTLGLEGSAETEMNHRDRHPGQEGRHSSQVDEPLKDNSSSDNIGNKGNRGNAGDKGKGVKRDTTAVDTTKDSGHLALTTHGHQGTG